MLITIILWISIMIKNEVCKHFETGCFYHAWKIGNYMGLLKGWNKPPHGCKMFRKHFHCYFFLGTVKPNHQMRILYARRSHTCLKEKRMRDDVHSCYFLTWKVNLILIQNTKKCTQICSCGRYRFYYYLPPAIDAHCLIIHGQVSKLNIQKQFCRY